MGSWSASVGMATSPSDPHQSETTLDNYQGFDVRIHNGGSLDALKQAVELSGLI